MCKLCDSLFFLKRICPWWLCFTFDNIFRTLIHDPEKILGPYVHEGNVALDIGPGMGYFTVPMARMVGENGRIIAADIQERMLSGIKKRVERSGLQDRIVAHLCSSHSLGINDSVDFILAFWMLHEVPDKQRFLADLFSLLKDNGNFLLAEPKIHTTKANFEEAVRSAEHAGFTLDQSPEIFLSRSAVFKKAK